MRHARFERLAEEKLRECFRTRDCAAGANEFVEDVMESLMVEFEHVDEYAELSACVLRVFRRLQEDTGNSQFASLCGDAYVLLLENTKHEYRGEASWSILVEMLGDSLAGDGQIGSRQELSEDLQVSAQAGDSLAAERSRFFLLKMWWT